MPFTALNHNTSKARKHHFLKQRQPGLSWQHFTANIVQILRQLILTSGACFSVPSASCVSSLLCITAAIATARAAAAAAS